MPSNNVFVSYSSHNKKLLLSKTVLIGWSLKRKHNVFCDVGLNFHIVLRSNLVFKGLKVAGAEKAEYIGKIHQVQ
jgi:hypothetical protein